MWAWVAFWGFCSVLAVCSCVYKVVHVRTLREPPPVREWEFGAPHDAAATRSSLIPLVRSLLGLFVFLPAKGNRAMTSDEFSTIHGKHVVEKQPSGVQRVWWGWGRLLQASVALGARRRPLYKQRLLVGPVEFRWWSPPFNEWKAQRDARSGGERQQQP